MQTRAIHRFMFAQPNKVRRYGRLIKGKPVREADAILQVMPSKVCKMLRKLLRSAVANAEHNHNLNRDELVVENVIADRGPIYKRIRPRARGRAFLERKRTTHVTIILEEAEVYRKKLEERRWIRGMRRAIRKGRLKWNRPKAAGEG